MIIRFIELRDFLGHEREKISLPEHGVIQLAGNSGSGKSSMISDAVGFALFGYRATRASKMGDLRRLDAPGNAFGVKVAFQAGDGTTIEVERGQDNEGRSFARLQSNTGLFADGITAVAEQLRNLFGTIDPKVYYRAFVARQDDMSALTEMEGSRRRDFIHQMLGIDVLDAVGKRLRAVEREQGAVVRHLEERVGSDSAEDLAEAGAAAEAAHVAAEAALAAATTDADTLRTQVETEDARLAPLRAARAEIAAARQQVAVADGRLPDLAAEQARLADQLATDDSQRTLSAGRPALVARQAEIAAQLDTVRRGEAATARRSAIAAEHDRIRERRAALIEICAREIPDTTPVAELRERVSSLIADHRTLTVRRDELTANRTRLAEEGVCSLCLREARGHDHDTLEALFDEQLSALAIELADVAERGRDARAELVTAETADKERAERDRARTQETELADAAARLDAERGTLAPEPDATLDTAAMEAESTTLGSQIAQAERAQVWLDTELPALIARRDSSAADIARIDAERTAASQVIAEAGADVDLDADEASLAVLRDRAAIAAVAVAEATGALGVAEATRRERLRLRDEHAQRAGELDKARLEAGRHRDLSALTVGYRKHLTAQLRPQLQETTSEILSALSNGRHPALRISDDYEIDLNSAGSDAWLPVRMISGGEKTRSNFALRLALTRLVSQRTGCPIRYLVMDEIFGSQDPGHRTKMLEVLRQVQVFYPQVFLISHVGDLRERAACDWIVEIADGSGPNRAKIISA